jgi:hypothetical protein
MYASVGYSKSVCEHIICDAYDKSITTIKQEKVMCCQPKSEHPIFPDRPYSQ